MRRIKISRAFGDSDLSDGMLVSMSYSDYHKLLRVARAADTLVASKGRDCAALVAAVDALNKRSTKK